MTAQMKLRVMPGLVPGIHDFLHRGTKDVDGRDRPGHDERESNGGYESCFASTPRSIASICSAM